ncbi:hypothetical protein CSC03_2067 [Enterobacter hormaechei]|nr:hypothetical protein CSC02_0157 [Enterobacter hormaechei subsp. hoffmannii]PRW21799.1 hypothetical protein CSC03_2067 [Enterobacter hormaechei]
MLNPRLSLLVLSIKILPFNTKKTKNHGALSPVVKQFVAVD